MSQQRPSITPTSNWKVPIVLWRASRARVRGRTLHQQKLWSNKTGRQSDTLFVVGQFIAIVIAMAMHLMWGYIAKGQIERATQLQNENRTELHVLAEHLESALDSLTAAEVQAHMAVGESDEDEEKKRLQIVREGFAELVAKDRLRKSGDKTVDHYSEVIRFVERYGSDGFLIDDSSSRDQKSMSPVQNTAELPNALWLSAGIIVVVWLLMLICQGEGIDLDIQKRRHPHFEWLMSHPVRPLAAFSGELLAPLMSNPLYATAPLFWYMVFATVFPLYTAVAMSIAAGLAFAVAASCMSKAIEIAAMLRMPVRSRGLLLGLISFFGFFLMFLPCFVFQSQHLANDFFHFGRSLERLEPVSAYFRAMLAGYSRTTSPGAVLQMILIPLAMIAPQALNFGSLVQSDVLSWNILCGLGILAGTYFLFNVGPRALASEGPALWLAQTWPQGLESLLKAKAKLWFTIATVVVYGVFLCAILIFPEHWWQILLVATGWWIFGWGLAQKSICLVTAPSSSGEHEKPPWSRRLAAMIGTFAFGAGVFAQSWPVAAMGVVFSLITAAAMWQNLRARLPYLFDRWSERLPQPPTVLHSVIAIALMVEVMGLVVGMATVSSVDAVWLSQAVAYGVVGVIAWFLMHRFLVERGVPAGEIWWWERQRDSLRPWLALPLALLAATLLAAVAFVYLEILRTFPATSEFMVQLDALNEKYASEKLWLLILAVAMAPLAEEYFFRGLLFRSLDREMHERKAILISSAYFAFFHPPVSWVPVFFLGVFSAWIFKRSGWLLSSVIVHMAYNFLVVMVVN